MVKGSGLESHEFLKLRRFKSCPLRYKRSFIMDPEREEASSRYEGKGKGLLKNGILTRSLCTSLPACPTYLKSIIFTKQGAGASLAYQRCFKWWAVTPLAIIYNESKIRGGSKGGYYLSIKS